MTHVVTIGGGMDRIAAFKDYNVAVLCLPALARATGVAVWLEPAATAQRTVPLPRGVTCEIVGVSDYLVARP